MCFGGEGTFVDDNCYNAWWHNGCLVDNRINVAHVLEWACFFWKLHSVVCFGSFG